MVSQVTKQKSHPLLFQHYQKGWVFFGAGMIRGFQFTGVIFMTPCKQWKEGPWLFRVFPGDYMKTFLKHLKSGVMLCFFESNTFLPQHDILCEVTPQNCPSMIWFTTGGYFWSYPSVGFICGKRCCWCLAAWYFTIPKTQFLYICIGKQWWWGNDERRRMI